MSGNKFDENDYDPKRFGIVSSPPQIIVEYNKPSRNKLYHHKIKIANLTEEAKIPEIIDEIYRYHGPYLNHKNVSKVKIIQLVEKLREKLLSHRDVNINDYQKNINPNENLNLLSKEELDKKKKEMDVFYDKNHIKKGDKNFQYDIRKEYQPAQGGEEWDVDDLDDI